MTDTAYFVLWVVAWALLLSIVWFVAWWTGTIETDPARLTVEEAHEISSLREPEASA
jgi:hypothetical protein